LPRATSFGFKHLFVGPIPLQAALFDKSAEFLPKIKFFVYNCIVNNISLRELGYLRKNETRTTTIQNRFTYISVNRMQQNLAFPFLERFPFEHLCTLEPRHCSVHL
jgi:hypothetical protein